MVQDASSTQVHRPRIIKALVNFDEPSRCARHAFHRLGFHPCGPYNALRGRELKTARPENRPLGYRALVRSLQRDSGSVGRNPPFGRNRQTVLLATQEPHRTSLSGSADRRENNFGIFPLTSPPVYADTPWGRLKGSFRKRWKVGLGVFFRPPRRSDNI